MNDQGFISIGFEFEGKNYDSLIRKKRKGNTTQYFITIMNGDLEQLLFGNHIITETGGTIQVDEEIENPKQAALKQAITHALAKYLRAKKEAPQV